MIDLDAVGQVSDTFAIVVGMRDDDNLVATIDEFARELIYVRFNPPRLGKEEVADHGDVVCSARHVGGRGGASWQPIPGLSRWGMVIIVCSSSWHQAPGRCGFRLSVAASSMPC